MTIESSSGILDLSFRGIPEELAKQRNIADFMDQHDREKVGSWALRGYQEDKQSRSKWEAWYAEAIKLALQVKEAKTFPWPGCANVKFPLLTIAALNAHAQAFPAILRGNNIVKCQVIGKDDPQKQKTARADRVSKHMNYQLLETMPWKEQTDKQLLIHYIMGTTFKKTYRDSARRVNCSELVMPQDLIINYHTKDMETCPRASHSFLLTKNELWERIYAQVYLEPSESASTRGQDRPIGPLEAAKDKAQLTNPTPLSGLGTNLIEQSTWLDLDGDGYDEPYAITFDEQTGFLYRIFARYYVRDVKRGATGKWKDKVVKIEAENYYTKFILIPSPDGGAYGMGLGRFLAPINDAVDTVINQMLDGNTRNLLGAGFSARGVRMKAGENQFKPGEFKPVDMTGDDIRKNIMALPDVALSSAAFDLLKYLVEYGERIGSSGDIQMGQVPGSGQMKVGTAQIANENGKLIFNSTYMRFWEGSKEEYRKLYRLNDRFIEEGGEVFYVGEQEFKVTPSDYSYPSSGILPAADPNIISKADKRMTAQLVFQAAAGVAFAGFDQEQVMFRYLDAHDVQNIPEVYPGLQAKPPQPQPKAIEAQAKLMKEQTKAMDVKAKAQIAVATLQNKVKESQAKIMLMLAQAAKAAKEAQSIEAEQAIKLLDLQMTAEIERRDDMIQTIEMLMNALKDSHGTEGEAGGGAKEGAGGPMGAMASTAGNKGSSSVPATA